MLTATPTTTGYDYRTLLKELPLLVWKGDASGDCEYVNQTWLDFTGLPVEAMLGRGWVEAIHPEDREQLQNLYAEAFQARLPMGLEFRMRHHSGEYRWVLGNGKPFYDPEGRFAGFLAACDDIHAMRTADLRIRRLTDLYAALGRTNHAITHARDRQSLFQEVCRIAVASGRFRLAWIAVPDPATGGFRPAAHAGPAAEYLAGMKGCTSMGEPGGMGLDAVVLQEGIPQIARDLVSVAPCPSCRENTRRHDLKAQAAFPLRVEGRIEGSFSVFSEEAGAFDRDMLALLEEMAADTSFALDYLAREERRRTAERALAVALQERQTMLEAASVAKVVPWSMDPGGHLRWGDSAGPVLGLTPADLAAHPGWPWHLLLEEDQPRLRQALREATTGLVAGADCRMRQGEDGRIIWTRWTLARDGEGFRGALQDITEQHTVQEQLVQSQKLESLGTLVGGIAHDFNNLLMAILGYCEIFEGDPGFTPRQRKGLEVIHRAAHRGRDLVERLLGFSRRVAPRRETGNLNTVLTESAALLIHALSNRIHLDLKLAPDLPDASFDSGQLHQVVMNLAINARDAIEGEGTLILRSGVVSVQAETAQIHRRLPGAYVFLEVEDTGCGIPEERLRRIFEPFYTTKGAKGTGLGLSMVHGIITEHGGFVECDSQVGVGTRIRVLLPLGQTGPVPCDPEDGGSTMRVLLLCGEPLRGRLTTGLAQMGHTLATPVSATGAIASGRTDWDLLMMDPAALDLEPAALLDHLGRRGWTGPYLLVGPDHPGGLLRPAAGALPRDCSLMELIEALHLARS